MDTEVLDKQEIIEELNKLIELDFDAIDAYDTAIERLNNQQCIVDLSNFKADHQRHIQVLSDYVLNLQGKPAQSGSIKHLLTEGKVVVGDLVGNDKAILKAMKSNEDQTNRAYEDAVKKCGSDISLVTILSSNLEDERRHRAWIKSKISEWS